MNLGNIMQINYTKEARKTTKYYDSTDGKCPAQAKPELKSGLGVGREAMGGRSRVWLLLGWCTGSEIRRQPWLLNPGS